MTSNPTPVGASGQRTDDVGEAGDAADITPSPTEGVRNTVALGASRSKRQTATSDTDLEGIKPHDGHHAMGDRQRDAQSRA